MKKAIISLVLVFALLSNVSAGDYSRNYRFVHDLIDCLHRLQSAALYSIEDVEYELILRNLHNQIPYFKEAKMFMKKWLKNRNRAIKATAGSMYVDISEAEDAAVSLINILSKPGREADIPDISKYASQQGDAWSKIFQTSGLALWVIAKPARSKKPEGKIPFIISGEERQGLIKYLNKTFRNGFEKYDRLLSQRKKGLIDEFELAIPVWSALHLRSLLTTETYEETE
ncbi:MAG: hypothetical protein KKH11_04375 [Candidatus Omnitrophica bacterium]|nr:hypothetical protein [Candidatus Omnitrophota bacterium]MBU4140492.1 hypothetical protein [Candidatus Omnitrophota bacterium]